MFEITWFFLLLIDSVQQIARYLKEFVHFGPNTPYGQEFTNISQKYSVYPVMTL